MAELLLIAHKGKQSEGPQMDEQENKMWRTNTLEYYLDLKRSGIWTHAATWMNLDKIMGSGSSLSEKTMYCRFCVHEMSRVGKRIQGQKVDYSQH